MATEKIGNYIHWKYSNYLRYGTGTKKYPNKKTWSSVYAEQKRILFNEVSKKITDQNQIKQIENNLNFFRGPINSQNFTWEKEQQDIKKEIIRIITQSLKLNINNFDFNTLSWKDKDANSFFERGNSSTLGKKGTGFYGEQVQHRLDVMIDSIGALQELVNKNQMKATDASLFQSKLKNLVQRWEELQNELSFSVEQSNLKQFQGQQMRRFNIANSQKGQDFITDLNKLWNFGKSKTTASIKGLAAEYWGVLTNNAISRFGTKNLQDILSYLKGIDGATLDIDLIGGVGMQRSSAALGKSFFASSGLKTKETNEDNVFTNFGIANAAYRSTQDKVDIVIELENLKIKGSVKNYSAETAAAHGYHLHKGSSILSLTQEYGTFVNHYLNITAQHVFDKVGPNISTFSQMQYLMKLTLVLKALQGGIYKVKNDSFGKSDTADIFITVENGLYKVYSMNSILHNIAKNINLVTVEGFKESMPAWESKAVGDYWFKPNYSAAFSRINQLLTQLHKFQLDISISSQALS